MTTPITAAKETTATPVDAPATTTVFRNPATKKKTVLPWPQNWFRVLLRNHALDVLCGKTISALVAQILNKYITL